MLDSASEKGEALISPSLPNLFQQKGRTGPIPEVTFPLEIEAEEWKFNYNWHNKFIMLVDIYLIEYYFFLFWMDCIDWT